MYSSLCNAQLYSYMLLYLPQKVNSDMVFFFEQFFVLLFVRFDAKHPYRRSLFPFSPDADILAPAG